ncbi:5520_t:CDS:2, partial [Funneliformis geosporum]
YFHDGLRDEEREMAINNWKSDYTQIMIATSAFGMEINSNNIHVQYQVWPNEIKPLECGTCNNCINQNANKPKLLDDVFRGGKTIKIKQKKWNNLPVYSTEKRKVLKTKESVQFALTDLVIRSLVQEKIILRKLFEGSTSLSSSIIITGIIPDTQVIPLHQRECIFALIQEGLPSHTIASCENISHASVIRIKQRKEETGSFDVIPKSGRSRILTECHDRNIVRLIKLGECTNAIQIQKSLISNKNIVISPNTIRCSLKRQGLVAK